MKKTTLTTAKHIYLVGIKGVGMTSLAQCLLDLGKIIRGWDVKDEFVTQKILTRLNIKIDHGQNPCLPKETEAVIYTVAHCGSNHPLVVEAKKRQLLVLSHAQALAWLFNQKMGVAVCGVGGKTTVSAMMTWIGKQNNLKPSFSVGVGEITGLKQTGSFNKQSQIFIAEADEYADNPENVLDKTALVPRFSYLKPQIIVCTNLKFDHPDVYKNLEHTKQVFAQFFKNLKPKGTLIYNQDDKNLQAVVNQVAKVRKDITLVSFGFDQKATLKIKNPLVIDGHNQATLQIDDQECLIQLSIPGVYNLLNAAAAAAAFSCLGLPLKKSLESLSKFQSTNRRCQLIKTHSQTIYYDDYAHHPTEVNSVIASLKAWHNNKPLTVIFQPHTVSRTKYLLKQFAQAFDQADRLILLPIFTSAREKVDHHFTSDNLFQAIKKHQPKLKLDSANSLEEASELLKTHQVKGVVLTMGAGNVYEVYDYFFDQKPLSIYQILSKHFSLFKFKRNESLAKHTTVGIGGPAEVFFAAKKSNHLLNLLKYCCKQKIPYQIIGWGANTLFADSGINGIVIKNQVQEIKIKKAAVYKKTNGPHFIVPTRWQTSKQSHSSQPLHGDANIRYKKLTVSAGASLSWVITQTIKEGLVGLENFFRIPATVGGAIYNNIHGNDRFFCEFVETVTVYNQKKGVLKLEKKDMSFGYDYSNFQKTEDVILQVELLLPLGEFNQAKATLAQISQQKAHQPVKSLGCVWQNLSDKERNALNLPSNSVGYLIDKKLKLSGLRVGDAQVSKKHAAFIENLDQATAEDYLNVIKKVNQEAEKKFKLRLRTEIFFKGFKQTDLVDLV